MTQDEFISSVARISAAQILRASGILKAKPAALDSFNDVLIRSFTLIGGIAKRNSLVSSRPEPELPDVRAALEEVGIIIRGRITPLVKEINQGDQDGENENTQVLESPDEDDRQIQEFIKWCKSDTASEIRRIAGVPKITLSAGEEKTKSQSEDWLKVLLKQEEKLNSTQKFKGTILAEHEEEPYVQILGMDSDQASRLPYSAFNIESVDI